MAQRIEDYALIGDCHTAALFGRDGSIDWLCLPRIDSGACFAALVSTPANGRWLLAPAGPVKATKRGYVGNFPQAFSHVGLVNTAFNLHRPATLRGPQEAARVNATWEALGPQARSSSERNPRPLACASGLGPLSACAKKMNYS
jgi:hypothetical protein